jgi:hypothetical protein
LEAQRKTAGKNSQPFVGKVPQQHDPGKFGFDPAKAQKSNFSQALQPFKLED